MAEIPVEKKGGIPWWVWLLLAAIIVALLIWAFSDDDDVEVVDNAAVVGAPVEPSVTEDTVAPVVADGAITDLSTLLAATDGSLVGRDVQLTNVLAGDVPDDAGFWIMGDNNQKMWVVLDEVRTPNTPIEGRVDVDKGDRVDIVGTVRSADAGSPPDAAIPGPTKPLPEGVSQFIYASRVLQSS
ncbi:hypothetical protein RM533_03700 [Croceicoccus sp. F390]|uniref:Uncharacterized protein n=1 Tax=Croceicoccus esteveae TaxID=3075597 RepID=A0ABU2ZG52_9SPHN|nr:hypothetical protein [Croceicoccus sp. F390]MDT0575284.1 hypothetical protein [Croceicoccus sp. F390]